MSSFAKIFSNILPNTKREKVFLLAGMVFLGWAILYYGIWAPLSHRVNAARESLENNQTLVAWIDQIKPQINAFSAHADSMSSSEKGRIPILEFLTSSLREAQIYTSITQFNQTNSDEISLQFKAVAFDSYLDWLKNMVNSNRVSIRDLSIERTTSSGIVNTRLVLQIKSK